MSKEEAQHEIDFTVNGDPFSTTEKVLTPVKIMQLAGVDPATNYLVQLHGQSQESYQGEPNKEIHMHPKMELITLFTGPTPVA